MTADARRSPAGPSESPALPAGAPDPSAGAGGAPERFRPVSWRADRDGYELHVELQAHDGRHRWWVREVCNGRTTVDYAGDLEAAELAAHAAVDTMRSAPLPRVGRWSQIYCGTFGERWVLDGDECEARPDPESGSWSWVHGPTGASRGSMTRDEAMAEGERVTEALKGVLR